jgi:hypothetical protein
VAGALLPLPLYLIVRDMAGRRAGAVAAWLVAVWPALFFFAAKSVTYRDRLYAGSEPLFVTLFAAGVAALWLAARRDSLRSALAAGAFLGLSVLTRDEGLPLFAASLAWFALARAFASSSTRLRRMTQVAFVAAAFFLVVSPWLIYIRTVSGRWSTGAKLENLVRVRQEFYPWIIEARPNAYGPVHSALDETNTRFRDDYWGVRDRGRPFNAFAAAWAMLKTPDMRWLDVFWQNLATDRVPLVPRFVWALIAIGIVVGRWDGGRAKWLLLIAFAAAVLIVQAVVIYSLARFHLSLVVLVAVPAALGLDAVARGAEALAGLLKQRAAAGLAWLVPPAIVVVVMAVSGTSANIDGSRWYKVRGAFSSNARDLALSQTLKPELPAGASFMSNAPWIAVYAGLDWRAAPTASPAALAVYVKANDIDFALLGDWQLGLGPEREVLAPYLVRQVEKGARRAYLYDFRREAGAPAAPSVDSTGVRPD